MRAWFRNLRCPTGKLQLRQQELAPRPRVEELEERCLLQGGPLTNDGFVTQLYRDVLKREPDPAGLTAWTGQLVSHQDSRGQTPPAIRAQVAQAFLDSVEYRMDVVQGFYNTLLHRTADPAGLNGWTNFLAQGGTEPQLEAQFLGSNEYFITRGGGAVSGYVQALYQDVLNRQVDPVGLQLATTFLSSNDSAASRTALASAVITSQEGNIATINHLYSQFLHRAPDSVGLSAFLAGFQENQSGSGNQGSGNVTNGSGTQEDPAQAGIVPAGHRTNGNGSNSGQASGITLEQAMVTILSSAEYFSIADR
jgi:hypothetical protein